MLCGLLGAGPKESFIDLLHTNTSKILTFTNPLHVYGSFFVFKNFKSLLVASRVLYSKDEWHSLRKHS